MTDNALDQYVNHDAVTRELDTLGYVRMPYVLRNIPVFREKTDAAHSLYNEAVAYLAEKYNLILRENAVKKDPVRQYFPA